MRVIARKMLKEFWEESKYSDSKSALSAWFTEAKHANWKTTQDVKNKYRSASFLANNRVVFNIHGNKYRLVVHINYTYQIVYIKFIGTHQQYDAINAETI